MAPTEYSLAQAFKRIQEELIKSMIRNFEKHKAEELEEGFNWDQWQVVQLRELEKYRRQNLNKFDEEFDDIHSQLEELLRMADEDAQTREEAKILDEILKGNFTRPDPGEIDLDMFGINERKLDSLIESTTNDLAKAEHAVLRRSNDIYRQVIYDAQVYAANGGTYEQAIDMATKDFCKRGITSIVYKNGSRHTIEDYASMAIRTAHKRAYLLGEGKKHAEYGIHTVRVAKRQDACPLCLRWTGKVLIDDVYGGGTKEEARQKRLPLLSTAMAKGFLHPNCRDVYSLYIEGVSKPAEPWTEYELRELADRYNYDQKIRKAETKVEDIKRFAETRIDPFNRQKAKAEWKKAQDELDELQKEYYGKFKRQPLMAAKSGGETEGVQGLDEKFTINTVAFNDYLLENHPEFFGSQEAIEAAIRDQYNRTYNSLIFLAENGDDSIQMLPMVKHRAAQIGTSYPDWDSYLSWMKENQLHQFAQPDTMFETFIRWEQGATSTGYGKRKGARLKFDLETGLSDFITKNEDLHYNGGTLYRGLMTSEKGIKDLQRALEKNSLITMRGPSSWTTRPGVAKTFSEYALRKDEYKVIFIEEGTHMRNAIPFPYSSTIHASGMLQNEVLYSGHAEFDILDITEKEGVYYVKVRERI